MQTVITKLKSEDCTVVAKYHSKITSPIIIDDYIFCVAQNGDILKYNSNGQAQIVFTILGQPSSLAYRDTQEYFIVSDFAHQSIFARQDTKNQQIHNLISQYNNRAYLGPNSIKIGPFTRNMYFTDSGPFLQTSLQNRQGSVFVYQFDIEKVICLTFRSLAYPSGLQCDQQQKYLIVSETGQNRLLRFQINQFFSGNYSVFYQFSGRLGPTAITRHETNFYVALFEFEQLASSGSIAVINNLGQMIEKLYIPIGPQITGLYIHYQQGIMSSPNTIYASQNNKVYKITMKSESQSKLGQSILLKSQK